MKKIDRKDLYLISPHSNLEEEAIHRLLKEEIYYQREDWQKFLRWFIFGLGISFCVSGIVFFFAYNWADLDKFTKIALIQGLLVLSTITALLPQIAPSIRKAILTGAAVMVGVLFAVFGQIYQTGANSYFLFLAWAAFITIWVLVSNYTVLWLLYVLLINLSSYFYIEQTTEYFPLVFICTIIFLINALAAIGATLLPAYIGKTEPVYWFRNTLALAALSASTMGISYGFFEMSVFSFVSLVLSTIIVYFLGIIQGLKQKSSFLLGAIPFSILLIATSLLFKIISFDIYTLLFISLFVIGGTALIINNLTKIKKQWANEN